MKLLHSLGVSQNVFPVLLSSLLHPSCSSEVPGHSGLSSSVPSRKPTLTSLNLYGLLKDFLSQYLILYIWSCSAPSEPLGTQAKAVVLVGKLSGVSLGPGFQ